MSIKSELNNTKYYLRESRKAILGRGGEISETAGIRDIPEAVWSIPADTSLAFRENSEVAYEKVVPVGAEEYALVKRLGGMCAKQEPNNLCSADGVYTYKDEWHVNISLGTYKAGSYYISANDNLTGVGDFYCPEIPNAYLLNEGIYFDLYRDTELILQLSSYNEMYGEGEEISGTIKDFMICYANDEDKTYKPFVKPELLIAKPTSIESRGANLFDIYRTDFVAVNEFTLNNYLPKSENGVMYSGGVNGKSAGACLPIYLKPNTDYYISFDASCNASTETEITIQLLLISNIENSTFLESGLKKLAEFRTQGHYGATFNSGNYKAFGIRAYSNNRYGIEFRNVNLHYGTTEAPYKPFSAEPIDTFELPENIEEGIKKAYEEAGIEIDVCWGVGKDAEYNNHIKIRNGRIIYRQMLGEFDLANVGEWKRHSTYGYFYSFPTISPAMKDLDFKVFARNIVPIGLSSKYDMVSINNSISSSLDKVICYGVTDTKYINIRDSAYTDVATFKEAMAGVKLVYALETPIETDITHLFTDTSPFLKVQGGGTIIAHNERKKAVPSTLKYTIKVG